MLNEKNKQKGHIQVSAEEFLLEYAKSLDRHRKDRRGVLVRLSLLTRAFSKSHHRRVAIETFLPLLKRHDGEIFDLRNGDIVCVLHKAKAAVLDDAVFRVRVMVRDDDNLQVLEKIGDDDPFVEHFDIEKNYDQFLALARRRFNDETRATDHWLDVIARYQMQHASDGEDTAQDGDGQEETPSPRRKSDPKWAAIDRQKKEAPQYIPINTRKQKKEAHVFRSEDLVRIDKALATIDLEPMLKKQSVCLVSKKDGITPVFSELSVPIREIQQRLLPDCDLASDLALLRFLRRIIDHRTLQQVQLENCKVDRSVSLRTTVMSILSPAFEGFHTRVGRHLPGRLVFELSFVDALTDISAFREARNLLRKRDYKICIGDLEPETITILDRSLFPAEFEKLRYSQEFHEKAGKDRIDALRASIKESGQHRVIMVAAQRKEALEFGMDLGVSLFQGMLSRTPQASTRKAAV